MEAIRISRPGKGRPRTRPAAAMGDKAYSSAANRAYLRKRGIKAVIPVKQDQKPTAATAAATAVGRSPSAVDSTKTAIPPDAASASSSGSAPSPPAMTSANSCIREPSIWRRSASGYETLFHDPWDTL
jgi:hypothetical protein